MTYRIEENHSFDSNTIVDLSLLYHAEMTIPYTFLRVLTHSRKLNFNFYDLRVIDIGPNEGKTVMGMNGYEGIPRTAKSQK